MSSRTNHPVGGLRTLLEKGVRCECQHSTSPIYDPGDLDEVIGVVLCTRGLVERDTLALVTPVDMIASTVPGGDGPFNPPPPCSALSIRAPPRLTLRAPPRLTLRLSATT